jgi:elongation factor P
VKVIASSVRKGNVLDIDGKLCVVLTAESFHPGKGTPTTQVDMRRISDGVKISQRYKTVERSNAPWSRTASSRSSTMTPRATTS